MNKKLFAAAALAATTLTAGLIGNVASANHGPDPNAPVMQQQQNKQDVKAPKAEPQKNDVKKQDKNKTVNEKQPKPQQEKEQQPPKAR